MTTRASRIRIPVGVSYTSDPDVVIEVLMVAARAFAERSDEAPVVLFRDFGASSLDFEVSVWTNDPWHRQRIESELRREMWYALAAAGITIAYPQLDVHLHGVAPRAEG